MLFQQSAPHFDFVLKMMWWVLEETAVKVNGKEAGRGRATLSDLSAELAFEGRWKEEKVVGSVSACRKIVTKWSLAIGRQAARCLPEAAFLSMAAGPVVHLTDLQLLGA